MSFTKYKGQAPKPGKLVAYTLAGLRNDDGSHPIVHLERLGEENRPYWMEAITKAQADTRDAPRYGSTPDELDRHTRDTREANRETMIRHSARKIECVFKDDGTPAHETNDVAGFIRSIPSGDFDQMFQYAQIQSPWREYPPLDKPEKLAEK